MPKARFYIRVDTFWQNSPDTFFGPYPTTEAAEKAIAGSDIARDDKGQMPHNTRYQTRCLGILTTTEALKNGMDDLNTIPAQDAIPGSGQELREISDLCLSSA